MDKDEKSNKEVKLVKLYRWELQQSLEVMGDGSKPNLWNIN